MADPKDPETPTSGDKSVPDLIKEDRAVRFDELMHSDEPPILDRIPGFQRNVIFHLAALGLSPIEISKQLGVHVDRIKSLVRGKLAKAEIQKLQNDLFKRDQVKVFQHMAPKAGTTIYKIMKDKKAKNSDRIAAAKEILDRAYGKPKQVIQDEAGGIRELYQQLDELNRSIREKQVMADQFDQTPASGENEKRNQDIEEAQFVEVKDEPHDEIDALFKGNGKP